MIRAILVLLAGTVCGADVNLLSLRSHWVGKGVSLLYPNRMSVLSKQLVNQAGLMTSLHPLRPSTTWQMSAQLTLSCTDLGRQNDEESDVGVGMFMTGISPLSTFQNYGFDQAKELFGMPPDLDGVGLLFTKNSLHVFRGDGRSQGRSAAISASHSCRAYLEKEGTLRVKLSASGGTLSVYTSDYEGGPETLCVGVAVPNNLLEAFYLGVSGSDLNSRCGAQVTRLTLSSSNLANKLVSADRKRVEEDTLAEFFPQGTPNAHLHEVLRLQTQEAKLMAEQLLLFADRSQKDIVHELSQSLTATEHLVDVAVSVIETESKQIENLNSILAKERKQLRKDGDQVVAELVRWFDQIEQIFQTVDRRTAEIETALNGLDTQSKFIGFIKRIQKVQGQLENSVSRMELIKNDHNFSELHAKEMKDSKKKVQRLMDIIPQAFGAPSLGSMKGWIYGVLAVVAVVGLVVLGVIYCRMRAIVKAKRLI